MATIVGMGQLSVARVGVLAINGLGSCVGLALYDPVNQVAGLAHIMLPASPVPHNKQILKGKYADTAIPELVKIMCAQGAERRLIQAKMAGGAQMFAGTKGTDVLSIGERNTISSKSLLGQMNIPLVAEDTGGSHGRNLSFICETGTLQIRNSTLGMKEI